MVEIPASGDHSHTDSTGIPGAAPQSVTPRRWCWGFHLSVEIFCALNVPNSAIAMRDRAVRSQGGVGVRHTRDLRPVFWTHRDPLVLKPRAAGVLYGARARCLRVAQDISGRAVTPVSTGRPCRVCAELQAFTKNCNQIKCLGHFRQILAFLTIFGLAAGEGLKQVA